MNNIVQIAALGGGVILLMVMLYFAFAGPSPAREGARRMQNVRLRHSDSANALVEAQMRKAIASRKPRIDASGATKLSRTQTLALRLQKTGKNWSLRQYMQASIALAIIVGTLVYFRSGAPVLSAFIGLAAGAGLPHMVVSHLIKKRTSQFTAKFPDAIELLVRGLRSGLPVTETLQVVAQEIPGPVGVEFRMVNDRIRIGRTMDEALQESADRLGTAEFQFFCITLAIQRETGGNLAETLSNLANVLRMRSQMKLKIRAMSSESKASAYIVGALPFLVFGMIWWINPGYVGGFFTDDRLIATGLGGAVWMSLGAFIMSRMVSFEI